MQCDSVCLLYLLAYLQRRAACERLAARVYRLRVGTHKEARHRLVPRLRGGMQRALAHAHGLRTGRRARGEEQPGALGVPWLGLGLGLGLGIG